MILIPYTFLPVLYFSEEEREFRTLSSEPIVSIVTLLPDVVFSCISLCITSKLYTLPSSPRILFFFCLLFPFFILEKKRDLRNVRTFSSLQVQATIDSLSLGLKIVNGFSEGNGTVTNMRGRNDM